jgi:hypothetical protein|nr:MAG TPA: hypothetical protein [Caudoviricetes sp.]
MAKVNEIDKEDLILLKSKYTFSNEELEKAEKKLSNKIGKKVVIIPNIFDIVSENNNKKRCVIEAKIDTEAIAKHVIEAIQKLKDDLRKTNINA